MCPTGLVGYLPGTCKAPPGLVPASQLTHLSCSSGPLYIHPIQTTEPSFQPQDLCICYPLSCTLSLILPDVAGTLPSYKERCFLNWTRPEVHHGTLPPSLFLALPSLSCLHSVQFFTTFLEQPYPLDSRRIGYGLYLRCPMWWPQGSGGSQTPECGQGNQWMDFYFYLIEM